MSTTGLVLDDVFERHQTGAGHPERPARIAAVRDALARHDLIDACVPIEPRAIAHDWILTTHSQTYLDRLQDHCRRGEPLIDCPDSAICPQSFEIAELAAGAVLAAVDQVAGGELKNAFCAVRPPGHHAERDYSMGFCMFNNVAIAARYLMQQHGVDKVLILDWDVHHGNGTQHAFESDPAVFFCSLHGHPHMVYPGTGFDHERGTGPGEGTTLNLPMMPGADDGDYQRAFHEQFLPQARAFGPQVILVSCGFDAHRADPLAPINLETSSFEWLTREVLALADACADGRLITLLEGGYDLAALGESAVVHVENLLRA